VIPDVPPGPIERGVIGGANWLVTRPPGTDLDGLPVVIALHGAGGDAQAVIDNVGVDRFLAASGQSFAIAAIDGDRSYWHPRTDGSDTGALIIDEFLPLLAATADAVHGVTSALLVVARMVGMLVGISALTTVGLRRYYAVQVDLPTPGEVCASGTQCDAYSTLLKEAGLAQLQTVFVGAAGCAVVAAVLGLPLFHSRRPGPGSPPTRAVVAPEPRNG
jgi:hypothetical protein